MNSLGVLLQNIRVLKSELMIGVDSTINLEV